MASKRAMLIAAMAQRLIQKQSPDASPEEAVHMTLCILYMCGVHDALTGGIVLDASDSEGVEELCSAIDHLCSAIDHAERVAYGETH